MPNVQPLSGGASVRVKAHPIRVPIFYVLFGGFFVVFGVYAWGSGSSSTAHALEMPYRALLVLVFALLGPIPLIVGALRLIAFLRWGQPSVTITQTAGRLLSGQFDSTRLPREATTLRVTLSCRRVRKTPVPVNLRAGAMTAMYGDAVLWSQTSTVDSNLAFQFQPPPDLPASESLENNPTFGSFWFLELKIGGLVPARLYFTLPVT